MREFLDGMFWGTIVLLAILILLPGCQTVGFCRENPRHMSCMTAEELEQELNK